MIQKFKDSKIQSAVPWQGAIMTTAKVPFRGFRGKKRA
jgi:hypothetical protein